MTLKIEPCCIDCGGYIASWEHDDSDVLHLKHFNEWNEAACYLMDFLKPRIKINDTPFSFPEEGGSI